MLGYSTVFGIDSHARTTTVCAVVAETGEVAARTFRGNDYAAMREWMLSFPQPSYGGYESGCTGFFPARALSGGGLRVVPLAVSTLPRAADASSRKNDRRDAERIARAALAGAPSEVWVPDPQVEGLRDLSSLLGDLASDLARARRQVDSLPLRHGLVWDERTASGRLREPWGAAFLRWVEAARLPDPRSQAALDAYLARERRAREAYSEQAGRARSLALASVLAPQLLALEAVKGCGFRLALAFASSVGDFGRFASGRKVTSFFGLDPRDLSSGERTGRGRVSKGGNASVRTLLTEGAWAFARARPARPKRAAASLPEGVREQAEAASRRLSARRADLLARGLHACKANTATAAEMARQLWAVGLAAQRAAAGAGAAQGRRREP